MSKVATPELKQLLDKRLYLQLNGNRSLIGILRGFDPFSSGRGPVEFLPQAVPRHIAIITSWLAGR